MTAAPAEDRIRFEGKGKRGGIMIVLDYPTKYNLRYRSHFAGEDERLMAQALKLVGLDMRDVYITFAYKYFVDKWSAKTADAKEAMKELRDEIREVNPHKILAMGGLAHAFLNGQTTAAPI